MVAVSLVLTIQICLSVAIPLIICCPFCGHSVNSNERDIDSREPYGRRQLNKPFHVEKPFNNFNKRKFGRNRNRWGSHGKSQYRKRNLRQKRKNRFQRRRRLSNNGRHRRNDRRNLYKSKRQRIRSFSSLDDAYYDPDDVMLGQTGWEYLYADEA